MKRPSATKLFCIQYMIQIMFQLFFNLLQSYKFGNKICLSLWSLNYRLDRGWNWKLKWMKILKMFCLCPYHVINRCRRLSTPLCSNILPSTPPQGQTTPSCRSSIPPYTECNFLLLTSIGPGQTCRWGRGRTGQPWCPRGSNILWGRALAPPSVCLKKYSVTLRGTSKFFISKC